MGHRWGRPRPHHTPQANIKEIKEKGTVIGLMVTLVSICRTFALEAFPEPGVQTSLEMQCL